ncbi:methyltransferase [Pseudomonas sp. 1152_12]|uniref:methyltransferase n=1 Tax=Pseudomonas sp. 1152_12 TaxID=2604455 RepID=UPI004063BC4A
MALPPMVGKVLDPVSLALYGFMGSAILLQGHRLGVFQALANADVGTGADALAKKLALDGATLGRFLRGAVAWGLVEEHEGGYRLSTSACGALDSQSPQYLGPLLEHFESNTLPLFRHLGDALGSGQAQWSKLAQDALAPFDYLLAEDRGAAFHDAMWNLSREPSAELVRLGVLGDASSLVDLGGGIGTFAIAAAQQHAALRAVVFDLPAVEPHCLARVSGVGLASRVSFAPGDFWAAELPRADAYSLGFILSDWNDEQSLQLLRRVRQALNPGGRVLVLDRLLEESGAEPFSAVMQDLAMLLETGGQHRTSTQFQALLHEAGFTRTQVIRSSGEKHAVIGYL